MPTPTHEPHQPGDSQDALPPATTIGTDDPDGAAATAVLPWYHSRANLAMLALAIAVLAGAAGYVIGNNRAIPDPNRTDVGFLQDMRFHHEDAVTMGMIFVTRPDTHPGLRTIAREIVVGQQSEIGRMIQLLRDFGEPESNQTDIAMQWMGDPMPLDEMPGLAPIEQLAALDAATGRAADELFVQLMVEHHAAGIHMAEHAAEHAATGEVRDMAAAIAHSQAEEITEMQQVLARAQEDTDG